MAAEAQLRRFTALLEWRNAGCLITYVPGVLLGFLLGSRNRVSASILYCMQATAQIALVLQVEESFACLALPTAIALLTEEEALCEGISRECASFYSPVSQCGCKH